MKKYVWKKGPGVAMPAGDAQAIGERLEELQRKHKTLNPTLILEDAKAKTSPYHGYFEWDNHKAADAYRKRQAAELLRHLRVEVRLSGSSVPQFRRAFVTRGPEAVRPCWRSVKVEDDLDGIQSPLSRAILELRNIRDTYSDLPELFAVIAEIDKLKLPHEQRGKTLDCLRCDRPFQSKDPKLNRICPKCAARPEHDLVERR